MNEPSDFDDVADALDRFGANPERWPQALRQRMPTLLASSTEAQAALAEAQRLEAALEEAFAAVPLPPWLRGRILANLPRREAWLDWLTLSIWRPAALACVPLTLGFALGMGVVDDTGDLEDSVLVAFSDAADLDLPAAETGDAP